MLTRLAIHDVVLIERLMLDFTAGLIVFTGETGAGKSILLDALGLALGGRSDAGLVRHGGAAANVTAEFTESDTSATAALLTDAGIEAEDSLVLRRMVGKDGKSRATINDQPVSIGLLRTMGQNLVEIHGQFESYGLRDPASHPQMLDAFGGLQPLNDAVRIAYASWLAAQQEEAALAAAIAKARADEDYLRAALEELDLLEPQVGEADALAAKRTQLQHREKILAGLEQARKLLADHRGATKQVNEAATIIAKIAQQAGPEGDTLLVTLDRIAAELSDAEAVIDHLAHDDALDPGQLNQAEERLFALRAAARKHQTEVDALPRIHAELTTQLAALDDQSGRLVHLAQATAKARLDFTAACRTLSKARSKAAQALTMAVNHELPALKLEQARLQIDLAALPESEWGAAGAERVAFLGQTNPGAPAGPLQKIASGGELARFMLALKVVLAAADPVPTLVFDEVDAGIGGATAAAVGDRLAQLAAHVQVFVVTHSPQVAARAAQHWRVAKATRSGATTTAITLLDDDARREEIARMLSGNAITDAARAAATALIAGTGIPATRIKRAKRA
ncbi:MAG: DNA repair protein RecN [Alphaproteobacteria bacterium]